MMEMVNLFKRLHVGCTRHSLSLTYVITASLRRYTYCSWVLFIPGEWKSDGDLRANSIGSEKSRKRITDQTIMDQVGHSSADMLKHYSHITRRVLNASVAARESFFMRQPISSAVPLNW